MKSWWCHHCFSQSVYKMCQRQPTALKLSRLIVCSKFHKICQFENHVTRNDFIMMSLPKTMGKCGPPWNQTKYISFERIWWKLSKNVTFIEFEPLCQKLWAFMSSFTMTTHQIWSCHVTLSSKFRKFLFFIWFYIKFQEKLPNLGGIGSRTKKLQAKTQCL